MKTTFNFLTLSIFFILSFTVAKAQVAEIGSYSGPLPKIDFSSPSTDRERDVNLTIGSKTITGKVILKTIYPDKDEFINTIKVTLKGEGIDIQTTTISCRTDYNPDGAFYKPSYIFDVFSGTVNGIQVSGYIGKSFNDKLFGSVFFGEKEMFVVKKSSLENYQLSFGDTQIGYASKKGMNKKGFPKIMYAMAFGEKEFEGIINHNGDLKNARIDYIYELSSVELSNEEISLWLFMHFSSEVFSGRTEIYR